jgi:hypothetical protein
MRMASNKIRVVLNEDTSMSELGKQFARAYGDAPEATLRAALSAIVRTMVREMMSVDLDVPFIEEDVEVFKKAAVSEWRRISVAVRSTSPGRA